MPVEDQSEQRQDVLRYVLIGCGSAGIGSTHINALNKLPDARIAGMSDVSPALGEARADAAGCPFYLDHRRMLADIHPDVAVILTPHPFHAPIALDCLASGAHVLVEKPMAVQVSEADEMIAASDASGRLLAVSFQQRFRPSVERARALIDEGLLGPLVRVLCVEPWFRTAAYYRSAAWRGTWRGEGGGVLMNQAPHTLDLLCHLAGMPAKVWGWTRTFKHAIQCEDTAQAMLEYPSGAPGYFCTSTVEAGQPGRLQIVGERGTIELLGDQLTVGRFSPSLSEFMVSSPELMSAPDSQSETIDVPGEHGGHLAVYQNMQSAIRNNRQPRVSGHDGRMSLELANAIILSSFTGQQVALPLDRSAYSELLADLRGKG